MTYDVAVAGLTLAVIFLGGFGLGYAFAESRRPPPPPGVFTFDGGRRVVWSDPPGENAWGETLNVKLGRLEKLFRGGGGGERI